MPNLPGRYEYSLTKGEPERATSVAPSQTSNIPCLGGCGVPVGPGQKCPACATRDTMAWVARREAERLLAHEQRGPVMVFDKKAGVVVQKPRRKKYLR